MKMMNQIWKMNKLIQKLLINTIYDKKIKGNKMEKRNTIKGIEQF